MKVLRVFAVLVPVALLGLTACDSATAPRFPDPTEPGAPPDTSVQTGSVMPPPIYFA